MLFICFYISIYILVRELISDTFAEDESEFDYKKGSEKGPGKWGELKKEWEACNNGGMQSPIDLSNQRVKIIPKLGLLNRTYKPGNATVKNRGHDISVCKNLPEL